jgi:hypothetical protein
MPPEAMEQGKQMIQEGKPNQFGAKGINVYFAKTGQAWCLSEAPDTEAVVKSHESMGIPLDKNNIYEVNSFV